MSSEDRLRARVELLRQVIRQEGSLRLHAEGTSMLPCIRSGEAITVRPPRPGAITFGSILQCRSGDSTLVHRLVRRIRKDGRLLYVTKGDNCLAFDTPVTVGEVLGEVTAVEERDLTNPWRRAAGGFLALLSLLQGLVFTWLTENRTALALGEFKCRHLTRRSLLLEFNRAVGSCFRRTGP